MQIDIHARAVEVSDELRASIDRRFAKIAKQVSESATLRLELRESDGSHGPAEVVAEAALHLKGTILRASDRSRDAAHAIHLAADELAVQVKRHQEKLRDHRHARRAEPGEAATA
jgi:ribosomal subunit interface protein